MTAAPYYPLLCTIFLPYERSVGFASVQSLWAFNFGHPCPSLIKGEVLSPEKIRATTGGIVLRQHNYFNRHNLNRHFGAKRRSQHFAMTATYQIITLYNPAVPPSSANRLHFRRRNLVQHIAAGGIYSGFQPQAELSAATRRKKSGHSNHHDRPYLIYYSV